MTLATPKKEVEIGACSTKYRGGCGCVREAIRPFGGCSYGPWLIVGVLGSSVWINKINSAVNVNTKRLILIMILIKKYPKSATFNFG